MLKPWPPPKNPKAIINTKGKATLKTTAEGLFNID
jgi:hypothetical protein